MTIALAHINLGDVPTWVAAAAAIVAGVYVAVTFSTSKRALLHQRVASQEQKDLLEQQLADQKATNAVQRAALERDRADREEQAERQARAQAERVSVEPVHTAPQNERRWSAIVFNGSGGPIRDVRVFGQAGSLSSNSSAVSQSIRAGLGERFDVTFDLAIEIQPDVLRYRAEFVDADGVHWQVGSDGRMRSRDTPLQPWRVRRPAPGDPPSM